MNNVILGGSLLQFPGPWFPPMLSPRAGPGQNTKSSAVELSSWILCPVLVLNKWSKSSEEEVIPFT